MYGDWIDNQISPLVISQLISRYRHQIHKFAVILFCALFIPDGNSATPTITPPTPVIETGALPAAQWDSKPEGRQWTKQTHEAVEQYGANLISTVPKDADLYCKSYKDLNPTDRRSFWVSLISSLAEYESNYDPDVTFDETTVDPKMLTRAGKPIISRGLLQISKESANGYGCGIKEARQLHDAKTNISCGVRIFDRWVSRDGVISGRVNGKWRGAARYFSPFRSATKLAHMQAKAKEQPFCR